MLEACQFNQFCLVANMNGILVIDDFNDENLYEVHFTIVKLQGQQNALFEVDISTMGA